MVGFDIQICKPVRFTGAGVTSLAESTKASVSSSLGALSTERNESIEAESAKTILSFKTSSCVEADLDLPHENKKLETKEPKSKKRTNLILIYKIVVNDCAKIMFFI